MHYAAATWLTDWLHNCINVLVFLIKWTMILWSISSELSQNELQRFATVLIAPSFKVFDINSDKWFMFSFPLWSLCAPVLPMISLCTCRRFVCTKTLIVTSLITRTLLLLVPICLRCSCLTHMNTHPDMSFGWLMFFQPLWMVYCHTLHSSWLFLPFSHLSRSSFSFDGFYIRHEKHLLSPNSSPYYSNSHVRMLPAFSHFSVAVCIRRTGE